MSSVGTRVRAMGNKVDARRVVENLEKTIIIRMLRNLGKSAEHTMQKTKREF